MSGMRKTTGKGKGKGRGRNDQDADMISITLTGEGSVEPKTISGSITRGMGGIGLGQGVRRWTRVATNEQDDSGTGSSSGTM